MRQSRVRLGYQREMRRMLQGRLVQAASLALLWCETAQAGYLDRPKPEVYLRTEDQERARLLTAPCTEADVGLGCDRYGSVVGRKSPCAYRVGRNVLASLPTDQCFKMEKPQRYRGVYVDAFEGQEFIPEGTTEVEFPISDPDRDAWKAKFERAHAAAIWLDVSRVSVPHDPNGRSRKMLIEFVGRKTMYSGSYGHMGMSGNEIIVDRVISVRPLK